MHMLRFLLLRVKPDSLMHRNTSVIYTDVKEKRIDIAKVGKQMGKQD
jgi:hypothetical protein